MSEKESIYTAKHAEFILAVRNTEDVGFTSQNGIVKAPRLDWLAAAQSQLIIAQRAQLEKDERYRQLLPYTIIRTQREGITKFVPYQRMKGVGESRLAGNVSIGWGGHVDLLDVHTGNMGSDSIGYGRTQEMGGVSPVVNLSFTLHKASAREQREELLIHDIDGRIVRLEIATESTDLFIADQSNDVGKVHLGLIMHAFVPGHYTVGAKEAELRSMEPMTGEELLAAEEAGEFELESWTRLYLKHAQIEAAAAATAAV